jgi:hypothetical protein
MGMQQYVVDSSILDTGPADAISLPDEAGRRPVAHVVAGVAARDAKHVGAAIRDGLLFEAASHACAALVGVGLWPLVEHAAHVVLGWVAS